MPHRTTPRTDIIAQVLADPAAMARFFAKVAVGAPNACWLWTGALNSKGYGSFRLAGVGAVSAHRLMCSRFHGPLTAGALALHSCDNRRCCNPAHLRPGSAKDNAADAVRRGRQVCGSRSGRAKLTEAHARALLALAAEGWSTIALARQFGISSRQAGAIVAGSAWRHVTRPMSFEKFQTIRNLNE